MILFAVALSAAAAPAGRPPLVQRMLQEGWPADDQELATKIAILQRLDLHDDASRLRSASQRRLLAPLLGLDLPSARTLEAAIADEAAAQPPLEQLREQLLHEGVGVDPSESGEAPPPALADKGRGAPGPSIALLSPGIWGAFDERITHTQGVSRSSAYLLLIPVAIRNRTTVPVTVRVDLALPSHAAMSCQTPLEPPGASLRVFCTFDLWLQSNRPEAFKAIEAWVSGGTAPTITGLRLTMSGDQKSITLGQLGLDNSVAPIDPAADLAAQHLLANASCRELGDCGRSAAAWLTNAGTFGMALVASAMLWSMRRRRQGDANPSSPAFFRRVFTVYAGLTVFALLFSLLDSPRSAGYGLPLTGALSGALEALLGLPWSYLHSLQADALPNAALRDSARHETVRLWFFIAINFAYLAFMAYAKPKGLASTYARSSRRTKN